MSGILDLLNSDLGKQIVSGVANSTGNDVAKTSNALTMGLPVMMKAMQRNASTPEGAEGLMNAISGKHSGGILDNLGQLFEGGVNDDIKNDGDKILGHVLGSKREGVEAVIGQKSGLNTDSVAQILKVASPILMGVLSKQVVQNKLNSSSGIGNLLGGFLGGNSAKQEQNFLEQILDSNGDGNMVDDVAGMLLGGSKKKKGLGGLLGGLFGK